MTDTINEARALLARFPNSRFVDVASALVADLEAARAELAAAREAMPSERECASIRLALGCVDSASESAGMFLVAARLADIRAALARLNAYHAAHPAASIPNTTTSGGNDG